MNKTIGLTVLLCLYLAFGLMGCAMYHEDDQDQREACEGACITNYFAAHPELCFSNEDYAYDKEHRELLGIAPGECVKPLDGYPTAAAGWLAAIEAQGRAAR